MLRTSVLRTHIRIPRVSCGNSCILMCVNLRHICIPLHASMPVMQLRRRIYITKKRHSREISHENDATVDH